ncbi:RmlC-like cupin domain-containing protein [Gamsiella multidivaricata]|uniref:RmlC-like cupin domain-containing protein n=1 Tax=Gamsiella multidivaricata TaxID=101098 RepID=UPI00221F64C8|nr:RmlC-like cupin domain-containing protein [Gamsiella multidivaricata]KAI7823299.1 RmlC-like cupin domain-containing protein [Gamsiella multidivaricata]
MLASQISRFAASSSFSAGGRHILKSIYAAERPEGMGAIVRRSLGTREIRHHDPFLLLDEFWVNSKGGFPDHPHRGFETVTYMLSGQMQHEDFSEHKGTIGPGDLQWMTAGRGIVHCEMPVKDTDETENPQGTDKATAHGLQLWVNLSHKDKSCDPQYQDLRDHHIPRANPGNGVEAKVIAGEAHGVKSKVYTRTPTMYLDYKLKENRSVEVAVPKGYAGFIYMLSGKAYFGDGLPHHALILSQDDKSDTLQIQTKDEDAHFVVLAGQPLKEPVVQDRLFVLNSMQEVQQTVEDFRQFKNGFENAKEWRSAIGPKGYRLKF